MEDLVESAWRLYRSWLGEPWLAKPSVPILWFGDRDAYLSSPRRVLTVGLNPSWHEFPTEHPFQRFPDAATLYLPTGPAIGPITGDAYKAYTAALNEYFRIDPYRWFHCFEPILEGLGTSFYGGRENTALHTDFCSPLATHPTFSHLDPAVQHQLTEQGHDLWHQLVDRLAPDVVLVSVKADYLDEIRFRRTVPDEVVRAVERENPYNLILRRMVTSAGKSFLLVFGRAAQLPFGTVSRADKVRIGRIIRFCVHCQGRSL
jgi:hypothetical protein